MEEIAKLIVDNGISVICVAAFIYYIYTDKKQSNDIMNKLSDTLTDMLKNLVQLNERVGNLEKKKSKKEKEDK